MPRIKTWSVILGLACLLCIFALTPARAQDEDGRDPVFEAGLHERLAALNPQAVPVFESATAALDQGDLPAARQGFEQVVALAPGFDAGYRRLAYVELNLGELDQAIAHARQALEIDDNRYNRMALASTLLENQDFARAHEARRLLEPVVAEAPDDPEAQWLMLAAGVLSENMESVQQSSAKLVVLRPDIPEAHFFYGLMLAQDKRWERAERELLQSQALGMPAEAVQNALANGISSYARTMRTVRYTGYSVVGWLVGLAGLFLVGLLLSKLALRIAMRPQPEADARPGPGERVLRGLYRVVIGITALYYYISIPFLILIVLAATAGVFYLFFIMEYIPIQLALGIGGLALFTLLSVARSLFARYRDVEPGWPLPPEQAPQLWALARSVAQNLGVKPVDAIYITPGSEIAVTERGGMFRKLRGAGRRCLILGLGVLPGMTQGQLQAILAHEYGHFLNRDTAGGGLARQVQVSIHLMANSLAAKGLDHLFNPAWLFVNGYYRLFLRVTQGASRLQEVLADRSAALSCGVRDFVDGLRHVVRQSIRFDLQVGQEVQSSLPQGGRLHNLYTLPELPYGELQAKLEKDLAEAFTRSTTLYDSHPSPRERIALVEALQGARLSVGSSLPAWDLIPCAAELQEEMTALVQKNVQRQLPAVEAMAEAAEETAQDEAVER